MKKEIQFLVKGSAPDPYKVVVSKNEGNLTLLCSCSTGHKDTLCKHRIDILSGVVDRVVSHNTKDIAYVREMIEGTDVERAMHRLNDASVHLANAQEDYEQARLSLIKAVND
ncbi:MAG: hypothetical protein HQL58_03710 [Magnetococcales bacterium]|nr:hypothetical protein [Magnetococcales bacterium]